MKPIHLLLGGGLAVVVVSLVLSGVRNAPRLTILEDGRPVANLAVKTLPHLESPTTDAEGTLQADGERPVQAVLIPRPDGGARMVHFPRDGHLTIDLRGRRTISTHRTYAFGFVEIENETDSYSLTDEEAEAVAAGQKSLEEVQAAIRKEPRPQPADDAG